MTEITNGYSNAEQVPGFPIAYVGKRLWDVTSCGEVFSVKNQSASGVR
jgi:hypothetical protein